MALVAVGAVRAAPGVTTAALALASGWPARPVTVVEADPDGGVMAVRSGLAVQPGLADLAAQSRAGTVDLATSSSRLADGIGVVVAPPGADATIAALRAGGEQLGRLLAAEASHVIADVGRLRPDSPALPFVCEARQLVVITRPVADELAALASRIDSLCRWAPSAVVLVGDGPYQRREVADVLGVEVLGHLPHDLRAAAALARGVVLQRRPLLRAAAALAELLIGRIAAPAEVPS